MPKKTPRKPKTPPLTEGETPIKLELWPIDRPVDYPKNARKWSQKAVDKVAQSLREFGFRQPIVVDREGVIIIGHLRRKAARQAGFTEVPVHVAADLSPAKVRALRLMDNRSHDEAEWDMDLLMEEMKELASLDLDLSLTGFDEAEFVSFVSGMGGLTDPDEVPPELENPVTRAGDLWLMGEHRLLCGDCRNVDEVHRLFQDARANMVITSPPYAQQREYDKSSGFNPIAPDEYVEWYRDLAVNIRTLMKPDASYFLNIKPSCEGPDTDLYVLDLVLAHVRGWGFHFATEFCWERNGVPKSVTQRFKNQFEPVYQFALGRWKMRPDAVMHFSENVPTAGGSGSGETSWANKQGGRGDVSVSGSFGAAKKRRNGTNVRMAEMQGENVAPGEYIGSGMAYPGNRLPTFAGTHKALGHVASFPVGLPDFFIRAYTDTGDLVYDPFMGSGSTLIAADQNQRTCFGLEISPAYCDVIVIRWQNFTGKEATLEGDGRTFAQIAVERGVPNGAS